MSDINIYNEFVSTSIGGSSLIGVMSDPPHGHGNYFWLRAGPRVVNFWAENLTEANKQFNLNGQVRIKRYKTADGDWCLIDDERIPKNWYCKKLCFTGGKSPAFDIIKDMYDHIGDPDNEIEYHIDPVSYYEKRGHKATLENGMLSVSYNYPSRKLESNWTIEPVQDLESIHGFDDETIRQLSNILIMDVEKPRND
jgi:hypothetical protein